MPPFLDAPPTAQDRAMLAVPVLAAVSGGGDSVAMLRRLDRMHRTISSPAELRIVHFNHGLRGDHSDGDEAFVRDLANRCGRPIDVGYPPPGENSTDEATLRDLRRRFNTDIAAATGARVIATGHTADDVVETVLHHLVRGTGPRGLVGPAAVAGAGNQTLWRPMLDWTGDQLRSQLDAIGQPYRTDASNADLTYTRNWIRHAVRPLLAERFPQSDAAIAGLAHRQAELTSMVDRMAGRWVDRMVQPTDSGVSIDPLPEATIDNAWLFELPIVKAALSQIAHRQGWSMRRWRASHYNRLASQIVEPCYETWTLPGNIRVCPDGDRLMLSSPVGG